MFEMMVDQKNELRKAFDVNLKEVIELVLIPDALNVKEYSLARKFLAQFSALSDKIKVIERSSQNNDAPLIKVAPNLDYLIEFFGVPDGLEIQTFIRAVALASTRDSSALGIFALELEGIERSIEVFVLPTCANCLPVALYAIASAIAKPGKIKTRITMADQMVSHAKDFGVSSVPHVALQGDRNQYRTGTIPVPEFVNFIKNTWR